MDNFAHERVVEVSFLKRNFMKLLFFGVVVMAQ